MKSKFNSDVTVKTEFVAYTMDYETNEIVMRIIVDNKDVGEIRLCEKDAESICSWFEQAKFIRENGREEWWV